MVEPVPAQSSISRKLYTSPVLWVFVLTISVLAVHPIPECIACEGPRPWGRDDVAYLHASAILYVWFLVASITAGFCSVRKYWLVPVSIVLAHLITQPLGGVEWWSLEGNEGPTILLVGCVAGASSLVVGSLIRFAVNRLVEHPRIDSQPNG
jgi:hypothetical protein